MKKIKVRDILNWAESRAFAFTYKGDENFIINGFSSLSHYKKGSLTWIKNFKTANNQILAISCAIVQRGIDTNNIPNCFITEDSKRFFFDILKHFFADNRKIAEKAGSYIGKDVLLAEDVVIGCNCVLDGRISIGRGTVIGNNVTVTNDVKIGEQCIIHSGTVIGEDGFGFSFDENNVPTKVPHFGGVVIGDRVEIGSNSIVNRGTIDSTIVGDDVKIDSLVLVAHNVEIEEGTIIVGGVTVGGSCKIGAKSYIAPQAIIRNQKNVGNNSFVGQAVIVNNSIGDNMVVAKNGEKPQVNKNYRRFL